MHFLLFSGALFSFTSGEWERYLREVERHITANTTSDGKIHSLPAPHTFGGKLRASNLLDESGLVRHYTNLLSPETATPQFRTLHAENIPPNLLRAVK